MTSVDSGKSESGFDEELAFLLRGLYLAGLDVGPGDAARLIGVFRHAESWSRERKIRALLCLLARSEGDAQKIRQLAFLLFTESRQFEHEDGTDNGNSVGSSGVASEESRGGVAQRSAVNPLSSFRVFRNFRRVAWIAFLFLCLSLVHSASNTALPNSPLSVTDPVFEKLDDLEVKPEPEFPKHLWKPCPVRFRPPEPPEPIGSDWLPIAVYTAAGLLMLSTGFAAGRHRLRVMRWRQNLIRLKDSTGARSFRFDTDEIPRYLDAQAVREAAFQISAPRAWGKATWIDSQGTVEATLQSAGQLMLRFGRVREHRPCLFIEDVSASMAPWNGYGEQLVEAIRCQGMEILRWFMSGAPDALFSDPTLENLERLEDIIRQVNQPVVVVVSACQGIEKDDRAAWLSHLANAFWLHPRQPESWDETSRWLNGRLTLISLDDESLYAFRQRQEQRFNELPWQPPRPILGNAIQVVASLRIALNRSTFDALTVAGVLCYVGRPTVQIWRGVLEKLGFQSSTRLFDRIWSIQEFSVLSDGTISIRKSILEELVRQVQVKKPGLLKDAISATLALLRPDLTPTDEISNAQVQRQVLQGRLLALAPETRAEAQRRLQRIIDAGFGRWIQITDSVSSDKGVQLSWRRSRPKRWLSTFLLSLGAIFLGTCLLDSPQPKMPVLEPELELLNITHESGPWVLAKHEPIRFCDVHAPNGRLVFEVEGVYQKKAARTVSRDPRMVWELSFADLESSFSSLEGAWKPVDGLLVRLLFRYAGSSRFTTVQVQLGELGEEAPSRVFNLEPTPGVSIEVANNPGSQKVCDEIWSVEKKTGIDFVLVPNGEFILGASRGELIDLGLDEAWVLPRQNASLRSFWISKNLVTNEQYSRFLQAHVEMSPPRYWNDQKFNQRLQPVVGVSWAEAKAYAMWAGLMIPSEAQWEAAARGRDGRKYPWGNAAPDVSRANFGNLMDRPSKVGSYPRGAGPFGTLDQAGNVWEWCQDTFGLYGERGAHRTTPIPPGGFGTEGMNSIRVRRGGSWLLPEAYLSSAFRNGIRSDTRAANLGFRVACIAGDPSQPFTPPSSLPDSPTPD